MALYVPECLRIKQPHQTATLTEKGPNLCTPYTHAIIIAHRSCESNKHTYTKSECPQSRATAVFVGADMGALSAPTSSQHQHHHHHHHHRCRLWTCSRTASMASTMTAFVPMLVLMLMLLATTATASSLRSDGATANDGDAFANANFNKDDDDSATVEDRLSAVRDLLYESVVDDASGSGTSRRQQPQQQHAASDDVAFDASGFTGFSSSSSISSSAFSSLSSASLQPQLQQQPPQHPRANNKKHHLRRGQRQRTNKNGNSPGPRFVRFIWAGRAPSRPSRLRAHRMARFNTLHCI